MRTVLTALAALLALAPAAEAAWTPPFDVSSAGGGATVPRVAVDADGDAVAVFTQMEGGNIRAKFARIGGAGPVILSAPGQNGEDPDVAVDDDGDALAVWERSNGANLLVHAAWIPRGGAPGPTMTLSAPGGDAQDPHVALDPDGDATVVWARGDVIQAVQLSALGAPGPVRDLATAADHPRLDVERDGDAVVVWTRVEGGKKVAQVARISFGGAPTAAASLSAAGQDAQSPEVAVDDDGDAVAVWDRSDGANTIVQAAAIPAGVAPAAPVDLSAAGQSAFSADVDVDPDGDAVAVWARSNGTNTIVQAARLPRGGASAPLGDLSAAGRDAVGSRVAVDRLGGATAVWQRSDGANTIIQAARAGATGGFGAAEDLSRPGANALVAQVAADGRGGAVAVWERAGIQGARFGQPGAGSGGGAGGSGAGAGGAGGSGSGAGGSGSGAGGSGAGAGTAPSHCTAHGGGGSGRRGSRDSTGSRRAGSRDTASPRLCRLAARRTRRGVSLRFTLSKPARVRFTVARCKRSRCRRVASFSRRGKAGANRVERRLAPGRYVATLRAVDAAGNRSPLRRVRFRVAR